MEQTLRRMVQDELKRYQGTYGSDEGLMHYLRNWHLHLPPEGNFPSNSYRASFLARGLWDETFYDIARITSQPSDPEETQRTRNRIGYVKLMQTPRKFYETIDTSLHEERIPIAPVKMLQVIIEASKRNSDRDENKRRMTELFRLTWPAVEWLWEFGYTREDITA